LVDNDLSTVWLMFDGNRSYHEVIEELGRNSPHQAQEIDEIVKKALHRLSEVNLIEQETGA